MTAVRMPRRVPMSRAARRETRHGFLFILPWIIGFIAFTALPMAATFVFTFLNISLAEAEPLRFVGLDNYRRLLGDDQAWAALGVTARFALMWLPVVVALPFLLALAVNSRGVRGGGLLRVLLFMPYVVPFVAGALIWQNMLAADGWINSALRLLGVAHPPSWLNDPAWVTPGLVLIGLWGLGAGLIVNLAGLRAIPAQLYDAALIDGAGWWRRLRHVTIPMMSPVLFYTIILAVVEVMQYFLVPLVLFDGNGDPGGATRFFNLYLYQTFFTFQEMSYGSTLAWLLFVITLAVTLLLFRLSRRWVHYTSER
ncbi:sugar ABC transporter permease [Spongiactinospora gelatinilytica]|uniref:Sugar ABC transporter permease n=1 Tax=Spongiactinospora gelatinilytica TaxID=2666298 RepID=A0A2W2IX86_9ACTN|nr:sugar ABC transporter permease [Spongiactinospora gelatinilytica]PZG54254.1 sugar ABC transporter permease [Spongiactinospora gelatinilytica]